MHTSELMKTGEFTYLRDGSPTDFAEIFPGFTNADRLGIVAASPGDSLKASPLLLASIGAFYQEMFSQEPDIYLYPDFFVFHVGGLRGRHTALDVWPQSKEVVVPADPQQLLAAINDRGITRLILPNLPTAQGTFMLHTAQLARRRLKTVLLMSRPEDNPTWTVKPSPAAEPMIARCARVSADLLGEELSREWQEQPGAAQGFTAVDPQKALSMISSLGETDEFFGFGQDYRQHCQLADKTLARDTYRV